jgi:transcriptional regulator with XRE-family HTH domain
VKSLKVKLTLQEKLRDLRAERGITLSELEKQTGIPKSTLQRFEGEKDIHIGYQDVEVLTRFYGVSADYLFGLTDHRQHRNIEIDRLRLTDEAVAALISGRLNTRLLSTLIVHPDFPELLAALDVFISRTISENMEIINKTYKVALDSVNRHAVAMGRDEYIAALTEASIDPDDYLRFRLSQRFDKIAQSLYDAHKKEAQAENGQGYLNSLHKQLERYRDTKDETGSTEQAKLAVFADQMGVDVKKATDEERKTMLSFFGRSKFVRLFRKRK